MEYRSLPFFLPQVLPVSLTYNKRFLVEVQVSRTELISPSTHPFFFTASNPPSHRPLLFFLSIPPLKCFPFFLPQVISAHSPLRSLSWRDRVSHPCLQLLSLSIKRLASVNCPFFQPRLMNEFLPFFPARAFCTARNPSRPFPASPFALKRTLNRTYPQLSRFTERRPRREDLSHLSSFFGANFPQSMGAPPDEKNLSFGSFLCAFCR